MIVNGPPGIGSGSGDGIRASDIVLKPCNPSPFGVLAAPDIMESVMAQQEANGGIPEAFFVITMARIRTRLVRPVRTARTGLTLHNFTRANQRRPRLASISNG